MIKGWKCAAFPQGIRDEIIFNKILHNAPVEGDRGIVFEQDQSRTAFDIEKAAKGAALSKNA